MGEKKARAIKFRPSMLLYVVLGVGIGIGLNKSMQSAGPSLPEPVRIRVLEPEGPGSLIPFIPEDKGLGNTEGSKEAMQNVLGDVKSPYPDIKFPPPVGEKPPESERLTLVAIATAYGSWEEWTLPLLQYIHQMPDAIDVAIIDDNEDETIAQKAAAFGFRIIQDLSQPKPLDQEDYINLAYYYFKRAPKYETLIVVQNNIKVFQHGFDRLTSCFDNVKSPMVLAPMINGMQVGEKTSDMDEKALAFQNSHHRRNRDYYQGRVSRDVHQRLPLTMREHHTWFDRALNRAKTTNMTSAKPVDVLQSFALAFNRASPPLPDDPDRIVKWNYNLFKKDFNGMVDPSVNGRPGDSIYGWLVYYQDERVPLHTCLNSFFFKDWSENGMNDHWGPNDWHVQARRNPKKYKPPKNSLWERG